MTTEFIKICDIETEEARRGINRAAEIIRNGGLVVMPTETVYGLGANGLSKDSVKKIYEAKGRPADNPLILHIEKPEEAEKYCYTSPLYYDLAKAFMPGPITIIMKKKDIVPFEVTAGLDTVAVRCPEHKTARALIAAAGVPIAAPSANLSGKPSPTNADYVMEDLNGRVDMIIDGGESDIGLESTIVMIEDDSLMLLRPGAVTYDALSMVCEKVSISKNVLEMLKENEKPLSPGMKYKHYAPSTPLILLDGSDEAKLEYLKDETQKKKCAVLCYDEENSQLGDGVLIPIGKRDDLSSHAHRLFSALREADKTDCEVIYAHLPKKDGLGLALYNRMIRAAAHTIKKV